MVRIHPDPPSDTRPGFGRFGAIAQLGERLLCKQEVTGSIPVGSTRILVVSEMQRAGPTLHTAFLFFGCSLKIRKKQGESGHLQTTGLIWVRYCIVVFVPGTRLSRPRAHQAQRETCGGVLRSKGAMLTVIGSSE